MCSLGFGDAEEHVQQQVQEEYAELLTQPLSSAHIQALACLFGWTPPNDLCVGEPSGCTN